MRLSLLAALALSTTAAAHADVFTLSGGSTNISFALPSSPTPTNTGANLGFSVDPVSTSVNGTSSSQSVSFYSNGGGLSIQGAGQGTGFDNGSGLLVDLAGDQLFSGTLADPAFKLGTYQLSSFTGPTPTYKQNFTLTIAPDAYDTFTLSDGSTNISFALPSSPTPTNTGANLGFSVDPVSTSVNGTSSSQSVSFYSNGGGLSIQGAGQGAGFDNGSGLLVDLAGDQLFSGALADPAFKLGTYQLSSFTGPTPTYKQNFTLTIAGANPPAVTPEPSTLALLGTGLLSLAGTLRRRPRD